MAYAEQMSRKLLTQDLETHFLTKHPKREVKSTDLTMIMVTILNREHNATKRKMCGKNDITSRHYTKYLHSRIHPNYVWVYFAMELRLVALGNSAMKVFTNRPTGYLQVYKATLTTAITLTIKNNCWKNMSLDTSNLFKCTMQD